VATLRASIDAPLPRESASSLIRVADLVTEVDSRWEIGIAARTWPRPTFTLRDVCTSTAVSEQGAVAAITNIDPFEVVLAFQCSRLGGNAADIRTRVRQAYEAYEHAAVEAEFERGALSATNPGLLGVPVVSSTGVGAAKALGLLEERVIGTGTLHLPVRAAATFVAADLLDTDAQGRLVTKTKGTRVVVGDGYTGAGPGSIRTASLTTALAGANNDLVYTARLAGAAGNGITVRYVDPAANNAALSVSVAGQAITVNLATGAGGAITSTAAQVKTAVDASAAAAALVSVANAAANNGTGVVTALAATPLAGGADTAATDRQWAYITGPVAIRRSAQVDVYPTTEADAFDPTINQLVFYAQRTYAVTPALDGAGAALVDLCALTC
jgi:hypothetical protein